MRVSQLMLHEVTSTHFPIDALEFPSSFLPNTRMRKGSARCGLTAKVAVPWTWSWAVTANLSLAKEFLPSTPDSTTAVYSPPLLPPIKRGSTILKEFSIRPPTRQLRQSHRKIDIHYPSTLPRLSTCGNSTFSSASPPAHQLHFGQLTKF
jgi:hypothetical protein